MQIHLAIVKHRHGQNVLAATDEKGLEEKIAQFCRDWWDAVVGPLLQPAVPKELIDVYFQQSTEETLEMQVIDLDDDKNFLIKQFLRVGEFDPKDIKDTDDLMEMAGQRMDKAYAADIVGDCLFESKTGEIYSGQVEFIVLKLTPEEADEARKEAEEEEKEEKE